MLDLGPSTPRPHIPRSRTPRSRTGRGLHIPRPAPAEPPDRDRRGLALIVDDGDPTLAYGGYRLYAERSHYLIRIWHQLTNQQIIRAYMASLTGEPRDLLWAAVGIHSWDDIPPSFTGLWGGGDALVTQDSVTPLVHTGRLLSL